LRRFVMLLGVVGMDKGGGCNGAYLAVKEQGRD
jgi:hypothetical protein